MAASYVYSGFQNPSYHITHIIVSKAIPYYPIYPPPDLIGLFPFVVILKFLDLTKLTNDPISHSRWWLVIPTKFPSDIQKFNGNPRENPSTHMMTYHL